MSVKPYFANRKARKLEVHAEVSQRKLLAQRLEEIQWRCKIFKLDPDLAEIKDLIAEVKKLTMKGGFESNMCNLMIAKLDPYDSVTVSQEGTIYIAEAMFGRILMPWTIINWLKYSTSHDIIQKIVVSKLGTFIYVGDFGFADPDLRLLAHYKAGVCNPHRLADPGNRLNNAALVVAHYTGIDITGENLWQKYSATFTLTKEGWVADYSDDYATAMIN